jgi:hypothetical protein
MKKLAILSITFMFAMISMQSPAQYSGKENGKKNEMKKELKTNVKPLKRLKGSNVSSLSKTSFYADFGDIPNVEWTRSATFDEARFIKDGQKITAYYDYFSKLVGTTSVKTFADVPADGQKEIKAKYKDYSIGPVIFFDDNEANETDMMMWNNQFDDEDNYFVELSKSNNKIMVRVDMRGNVFFFKKL